MKISPEKLSAEAEATGFRPDVLEKVAHLLGLLNAMQSHPFLKGKLVLKGGTALNLFVFDVPRLSVDIDLNHVGAGERDDMLAEHSFELQDVVIPPIHYIFLEFTNEGERYDLVITWLLRLEEPTTHGPIFRCYN